MGLVENVEFWKEKASLLPGSKVNQIIAPSGAMQGGEFLGLFYGFKSCAVLGQDAYLIEVLFCVHGWGWLGDGLAGAAFVAVVCAWFDLVAAGVGRRTFAGGLCNGRGGCGGLWLWHKRFFWFHVVELVG
jgi:hypothetical protein